MTVYLSVLKKLYFHKCIPIPSSSLAMQWLLYSNYKTLIIQECKTTSRHLKNYYIIIIIVIITMIIITITIILWLAQSLSVSCLKFQSDRNQKLSAYQKRFIMLTRGHLPDSRHSEMQIRMSCKNNLRTTLSYFQDISFFLTLFLLFYSYVITCSIFLKLTFSSSWVHVSSSVHLTFISSQDTIGPL